METHLEFEKPLFDLEQRIKELKRIETQANGNNSGGLNSTAKASDSNTSFSKEIQSLSQKLNQLTKDTYANLTPWQRVLLSRHPSRPYALDYFPYLFSNIEELRGDRAFKDDKSCFTGLARFSYGDFDSTVAVVAPLKGRSTKEKVERNFGMMRPEGYRKALRLYELAERLHFPVISLVDTPGAFPGIDAEERGQSHAIAACISRMLDLKTVTLSVIIGEGGSGGALALAATDIVLVQEYAIYSVISPESCASILWSDSAHHERAAELLKITANDLSRLKVIDGICPEPVGGAHRDTEAAAQLLKKAIGKHLTKLSSQFTNQNMATFIDLRRKKFRNLGAHTIKIF